MSKSTISTFELFQMFPDQESARLYLESRLWPDGVACPTCRKGERITTRKGGYYRCNACRGFDFTWRTGTIFQRGHIPPNKLLAALMLFAANPEVSPTIVADQVGLTHKTAWLLLRDLREAAGDFFLDRLELGHPDYRLIDGFPAYRVGRDGSIWTRWRRGRKKPELGWTWREMRPIINKQRGGYRNVILYDGSGLEKHERVCRLVCAAFHGKCPAGLECRHKDGNPINDIASNLSWATHLENMGDCKIHGTMRGGTARGERNGNAKLTDAEFAEVVSLNGSIARRFVAKRFHISPTRVSQIWSGRRRKVVA